MFIIHVGMLECGRCKREGLGVTSLHHDDDAKQFQINLRCLECFALLAEEVPLFTSIRSLMAHVDTPGVLRGLEESLKET
jgi:hypothetical protein